MITLGEIKEIKSNGTLFSVNLPIFKTAGDNQDYLIDCKLCYQPGNMNGYITGDIVVVAFVDNQIGQPIILGKLYKGNEKTLYHESGGAEDETSAAMKGSRNFSYAQQLEVVMRAILPTETTIGDSKLSDLIDKITELSADMERLREKGLLSE